MTGLVGEEGKTKGRSLSAAHACEARKKERDGKLGRGRKNTLENLGLVVAMWSETPFQLCISSSKFWGV